MKIFVTVGTHEQSFDRLITQIDKLVGENAITKQTFIQTGYSDFVPENTLFKKFLTFQEMQEKVSQADLVVTHGGPATFFNALVSKKKVIIVPRLSKYNEHVNDHQKIFLDELIARGYNLEVVDNILDLEKTIKRVEQNDNNFESHNAEFVDKFEKVIRGTHE